MLPQAGMPAVGSDAPSVPQNPHVAAQPGSQGDHVQTFPPLTHDCSGAAAGRCGLGGAVWQDAKAIGLRAHRPVLPLEIVALRLDAVVCEWLRRGRESSWLASRRGTAQQMAGLSMASPALLPTQSCTKVFPSSSNVAKVSRPFRFPSSPLTNRVWVAQDVAKLRRVGGMTGRACQQLYGCSPMLTNLHGPAQLLINLQQQPSLLAAVQCHVCLYFTSVKSVCTPRGCEATRSCGPTLQGRGQQRRPSRRQSGSQQAACRAQTPWCSMRCTQSRCVHSGQPLPPCSHRVQS